MSLRRHFVERFACVDSGFAAGGEGQMENVFLRAQGKFSRWLCTSQGKLGVARKESSQSFYGSDEGRLLNKFAEKGQPFNSFFVGHPMRESSKSAMDWWSTETLQAEFGAVGVGNLLLWSCTQGLR